MFALRLLAGVVVGAALCLVSGLPVLAMGLVVPVYVVWPLALLSGVLLAAVGASWVGNLFTRNRSCLIFVVGVAGASAVVLSGLTLAASPVFWPSCVRVGSLRSVEAEE